MARGPDRSVTGTGPEPVSQFPSARCDRRLNLGLWPGDGAALILDKIFHLTWKNRACRETYLRSLKGTFRVQLSARNPKIMVSADGTGIVSQAGGLLLTQALRAQAWTAGWTRRRPVQAVHGPRKIITDLATMSRARRFPHVKTGFIEYRAPSAAEPGWELRGYFLLDWLLWQQPDPSSMPGSSRRFRTAEALCIWIQRNQDAAAAEAVVMVRGGTARSPAWIYGFRLRSDLVFRLAGGACPGRSRLAG